MQKKETAIEVKVGALFLFSMGLLIAFVIVLGDFSFGDGFRFNVEFDNAGGLKPGADVAIAGLTVGNVQALQFTKNEDATAASDTSAVAVRANIRIDGAYADSIRTNSDFFITTRGVLGEPYIEIVTPDFAGSPVQRDAVLRGVDPPRMDIIISKASDLLTVLTELLDDPDIQAKELLANTASLMKNLDLFLTDNRPKLDATLDDVRDGAASAKNVLAALDVAIDDGQELKATFQDTRRLVRNADRIATRVGRDIDPIMDDVKSSTTKLKDLTDSADRLIVQNEQKIDEAITNLHSTSERLDTLSTDAQEMVSSIKRGEGTVGALLSDREIYDDLKEMLRVIKQRPWKLVWKE